jgi:hypothetical protein
VALTVVLIAKGGYGAVAAIRVVVSVFVDGRRLLNVKQAPMSECDT